MLQVLVRHSPTDRTETEMFFVKKSGSAAIFVTNCLSPCVTRQIADIDEIAKEAIVWAWSLGREFWRVKVSSPFFLGGLFKSKTGETRAAW